ncbi:hypothetical protein [Oerskovia sp. Root22]|uniref:hypothetical protein n=1 Tax=Oerskovia sp. Root22 TaxID=1736494 RepID=UPI0006FE2B69|nr:hypothetical protein [Oerskovia sp. Root22]KRC42719.1 hypothetical protein ASE15_01445 [Oerskovia sp. Root22]
MPYDQAPETPVTPEQAVAAVQAFIDERAASRVLIAGAFTKLELVDGVLTATWSEAAIVEEKSNLLLGLNPFENLAVWLGTPLSFDNEEGRQIRQHVHAVSVIGPFGVGSMSVRDLYERATGLRYDQP